MEQAVCFGKAGRQAGGRAVASDSIKSDSIKAAEEHLLPRLRRSCVLAVGLKRRQIRVAQLVLASIRRRAADIRGEER